MKIETYLFGSVEVNPETVITFPVGLVGFESAKRFMLVHEETKGELASFTLQSIDEPTLAFQIIDPTALGFNYELGLSDAENAMLQSPAGEDVAVMLVMFKQEGEENGGIRPNIRAPLLINTRARVGLQKIMEKVLPNVTLSNLVSSV